MTWYERALLELAALLLINLLAESVDAARRLDDLERAVGPLDVDEAEPAGAAEPALSDVPAIDRPTEGEWLQTARGLAEGVTTS